MVSHKVLDGDGNTYPRLPLGSPMRLPHLTCQRTEVSPMGAGTVADIGGNTLHKVGNEEPGRFTGRTSLNNIESHLCSTVS